MEYVYAYNCVLLQFLDQLQLPIYMVTLLQWPVFLDVLHLLLGLIIKQGFANLLVQLHQSLLTLKISILPVLLH